MYDVSFNAYWAGLQKTELEQQVLHRVETIKNIALLFHNQDMKMKEQEERRIMPYAGQA